MRGPLLAFLVATAFAIMAQSAAAQTAHFSPTWVFGYADAGYNILACAPDSQIDTTGKPYQTCLNIYCEKGYGVSFGLGTGFSQFSGPFTATLTVDGIPRQTLAMKPLPNGIQPYAELDASSATELFRTLSSGQTLSLVTKNIGSQPRGLLAFPLAGAAQALGAMNAECLLGQPNGAVVLLTDTEATVAAEFAADATPETDPARFVKTSDVAVQDGRAMQLARALLAARIAEAEAGLGRPIEVRPELVPFQDGRQLLIVFLCDATWFGITGCETWMYTAAAGATQFSTIVSENIGAGPYWLDLKMGVNGWPDLLSQPYTANGAFVRSRWSGTQY